MKKLSKNQFNKGIVSQTNDKIKEKSKLGANETVTPGDILFSLKPLLDEYFVGIVSCNANLLTYQTVSGQNFRITVMEEI